MTKNMYATKLSQAVLMPSGGVARIRKHIRSAALSTLAVIKRAMGTNTLRCLYCHYVFDDQMHDFDRLISALKRYGRFVNTETCMKMLNGKEKIYGHNFHLSFDDGFRNNFTNALPILKKHKVPAIFFVPSSLVNAEWEAIRKYCLNTTSYNAVIEMLNWQDLAEIISSGYEVGSHTRTHARFSDISQSKDLLEYEILGSKKELEMHLGVECKYISWPYGRINDANLISLEATVQAGYHACFGAFRGSVFPGVTNKYSIPRHHFEVQWPISHILFFARGNMEKSDVGISCNFHKGCVNL